MSRAAWPVVVTGLRRLVFLALPLAGLGAVSALGCAEAPHGPLVGASDAWETTRDGELPKAHSDAPPVWELYSEVQHWPTVSAAPFTAQGHQPEQSVEVRANAAARESYAGLVTDTVFPEGSLLVELSRGTGHGYAMRKASGVWSYFELDAKGRLLASGTPLAQCAGCHAQAPADHVFGPPHGP